jgi:hypothetical protein
VSYPPTKDWRKEAAMRRTTSISNPARPRIRIGVWWVAVALALPLCLGPAAAQLRRCLQPAEQTGRTCPEDVCVALQDQVDSPLACGGARACKNLFGCSSLLFMRQVWKNCQDARNTINITCWGGGNEGHRAAATMAGNHVAWCTEKIAKPEPEGCGDPCEELLTLQAEPSEVDPSAPEDSQEAAPKDAPVETPSAGEPTDLEA